MGDCWTPPSEVSQVSPGGERYSVLGRLESGGFFAGVQDLLC